MNILIFSWRSLGHPNQGGAEQVTFQYAKGWVKAGHSVTLFSSSYFQSKGRETVEGVNIIRKGDQFIGVRIQAIIYYLLSKQKPDLVVDEFHGIPFFSPLWAFKSKKLGFIHEVAQKVWDLNPWPWPFNMVAAVFGKTLEPHIFKTLYQNTPFLTVSESTKKDLAKLGVRDVTVIKNGAILPSNVPNFKKESNFTILYFGAIAKDKGIEDAIKVFDLLKGKIKNIKFWVGGRSDPNYLKKLKALCPEMKYWGPVPDPKKFELMRRASVFVFPSVHEGWGLVAIEAAFCGTPVVGYNVSGVREAVLNGKTGLLSSSMDPAELSGLVIKLYENKAVYNNLSKNSLSWGKKFKWEDSIAKSLTLVNTVCQIRS